MIDDTIETKTIDALSESPPEDQLPEDRETATGLELEDPILEVEESTAASVFKAAPRVPSGELPPDRSSGVDEVSTPPSPHGYEERAIAALEKLAEAHRQFAVSIDDFEQSFRSLSEALELLPARIAEYIQKRFHGM